jgi:hypothetical protein
MFDQNINKINECYNEKEIKDIFLEININNDIISLLCQYLNKCADCNKYLAQIFVFNNIMRCKFHSFIRSASYEYNDEENVYVGASLADPLSFQCTFKNCFRDAYFGTHDTILYCEYHYSKHPNKVIWYGHYCVANSVCEGSGFFKGGFCIEHKKNNEIYYFDECVCYGLEDCECECHIVDQYYIHSWGDY